MVTARSLAVAAFVAATAVGPAPGTESGLPLPAERLLDLAVDEGTWMSLDVSPDGQTIVFDLLGDLYALPIAGGTARALTEGLAFESQPRFSPDGRRIAYVSDATGSENVWVADADGSAARPLGTERDRGFSSPAWTADGRHVLVSRGIGGTGPAELWKYPADGGAPERLAASGDQRYNYLGAVASPDGRSIYYARRRGTFSWTPTLPTWQVFRRELGREDAELLTAAMGSAFRPLLSHDGTRLVYGTRVDGRTGLRLRDLASGAERWLKYPVQNDDQEARSTRDVLPGYAFTPDDAEVVLSYGGRIWRVGVETGVTRPIPFQARARVALAAALAAPSRVESGPVRAHLAQRPRVSPDGSRVAFAALGHVYWTALAAPRPVRLTEGDAFEFQPAWSPDGRELAYVTWSEKGGHVMKLRPGSGEPPRQLTDVPAYYHDPVFSPDGATVVALRSRTQARLEAQDGLGTPEPEELLSIPAGGGRATRITSTDDAWSPHFGADPSRVYVTSSDGLESMRLDGSDRRAHLKVVGRNLAGVATPAPADLVLLSPDERRAAALVNKQLFVFELGAGWRDGLTVDVGASPAGLTQVTRVGADDASWADGGGALVWSLGASVFRRGVAAEAPVMEVALPVAAPRDVPPGALVLTGVRLITMRGDEVIADGELVLSGGRITAVGARGRVARPEGATVLDLPGTTVMPGLVDVHEHWHELSVDLVQAQNWPLLASLAYGVTSTRDPQSRTVDVFLYQDLVDSGRLLGPRLFSTGPGIFSNTPLRSAQEAADVVARYARYYRTNTVKAYNSGDRRQRQWIAAACREQGLMATTEGSMDLKLDLTHVLDGFSGNEHALPVAPLARDVVDLMARSGIAYTPTLVLSYGGPLGENFFYETTEVHGDPKLRRFVPQGVLDQRALRRSWYHPKEHVFPRLAESAAAIARAGGRVLVGAHGQFHGLGTHWEMWALASGGLSNHEVLRAATLHGASALGYERDLGSLEPGKLADLLVLDRDPLADIRATTSLRLVMKGGRLYSADTLEQVWPERVALGDVWWRDPAADPSGPPRARTAGARP
jgi:Tol biopolymer transport system component